MVFGRLDPRKKIIVHSKREVAATGSFILSIYMNI